MKLKLFTRKDCPNCPPAKKTVKELEEDGVPVDYHDVDDIDGMVEARFHMVMATPTTVLLNDKGEEIDSWRGSVPDAGKIKAYFSGVAKLKTK